MSPAARLCTFIVEPLDTLTLTFLSSPSDSTAAMALPAGAMVPPRSAVPMVSRVGSALGAAQPGSTRARERRRARGAVFRNFMAGSFFQAE